MYVENRRYSVLALIFRIIGLIAIITSLFLFIFDIRIVYKGIVLWICSIPLFSSILALIFEHLIEVKKDIVYKVGLLILDIILMLVGLVSLFLAIVYMF